jgi:hypothetical protein
VDDHLNEAQAWWQQLNNAARGTSDSVDNFLHTLHTETLGATKTTFRTHWLVCDPDGRPRLAQLAERLAHEVMEYCIPRDRIDEAAKYFAETGSMNKVAALHEQAKMLFTKLEKSGEGGELLLYFLMEVGLQIPQIMCKMALKTSTEMHIHGVDGVHAMGLPNGELALYWGESKVYDDFESAARACLSSISPYLKDDGTGPSRQDLFLARTHLDAGSAEVSLQVAKFLTDDTPESSHLHIRGACLIGFSQEAYGSPFEVDGVTVAAPIVTGIGEWRETIRGRVSSESVQSIEIEFFCVPLPSADLFRAAMRKALGIGATAT